MAHFRRHSPDQELEDLNLVPIMNLVVCLIPLVLLGTALVKIGVVNVSTPKFGGTVSDSQPDSDEKKLNLTLAVGEDGYRISAAVEIPGLNPAQPETPEGVAPSQLPPTVPKLNGDYDLVALYNKMVEIKNMHPNETILILTADPKTQYKDIIRTMDVVRYRLAEERYSSSDMAAFKQAEPKIDDTKDSKPRMMLWPDVVFSIAQ